MVLCNMSICAIGILTIILFAYAQRHIRMRPKKFLHMSLLLFLEL